MVVRERQNSQGPTVERTGATPFLTTVPLQAADMTHQTACHRICVDSQSRHNVGLLWVPCKDGGLRSMV